MILAQLHRMFREQQSNINRGSLPKNPPTYEEAMRNDTFNSTKRIEENEKEELDDDQRSRDAAMSPNQVQYQLGSGIRYYTGNNSASGGTDNRHPTTYFHRPHPNGTQKYPGCSALTYSNH